MTGIYRNSSSEKISTNQKMTRDPFDIPEIARLRDWANSCVQRGLVKKEEKHIAISTPTVYNIPSSTNRNRVYSVQRDLGNIWTCDCPAMQYYSGYCKHIKQVQDNA